MESRSEEELWAAVQRQGLSLGEEYGGIFSQDTIDQVLVHSFDQLRAGASVRRMLPLLTYRFTKERLQALGQAEGLLPKDRPDVVFVCNHNAGRSPMAAAFTIHLSHGRVNVHSGGTGPAGDISPIVFEAMSEMGVDLTDEFPKPLTDEVVRVADVVITMGSADACPLFPGKRHLDWELDDPTDLPLEKVRVIRDQIRANVEELLQELGAREPVRS